ncbi:hypothetical protein [Legionella fairfieldensis]|uniref:hypothetical protein n=1 Tax=Legionella fairfieldensis TaxID=45064 RepID=UPI00048E2B33|nr:hypothetical protein [Legionella fairfieldensis]
MINITELQRGDIIIVMHNGTPYHAAIYASNPEYIGDVIHACSGFKRSGVTRGTLAHLYHLHHGMNKAGNFFHLSQKNTLEIHIFRSKTLSGEAIANQAERWLLQGVTYDEKRLADTVENCNEHQKISREVQILNVFEYLKFAARRETAPIKTPFFPYPGASVSSVLGSFFVAPSLNLPTSVVNVGLKLMKKGANYDGRVKGFSCAGFVLACIGAVALQDEISPLTPQRRWVSLKYGKSPQDPDTSYAKAWQCLKDSLGELKYEQSQSGLDTLLSEEQIQQFDIDRLINKLSFLANLHPHHPSIRAFIEGIQSDDENWQNLGSLNEIKMNNQYRVVSRPFTKKDYKEEKAIDMEIIKTNHHQFGRQYGESAFKREYPKFLSKKMISAITGETVSDIIDYKK